MDHFYMSAKLITAFSKEMWKNLERTLAIKDLLPVEVELATDLWIGSTGVRHVVAVEGHHVGQHVRCFVMVWIKKKNCSNFKGNKFSRDKESIRSLP